MMLRTMVVRSVALLALVVGVVVPVRSASAAAPAYLTLLLGRTQWVTMEQCAALPNTIPLDQVATALSARGLAATGSVIIDRTSSTDTPVCWATYTTHPTWSQLAMLRDSYGWTFISASRSYVNMTTITPQQQWDQSCGTLPTFAAHGHDRAWGLFAYPDNHYTTTIQTDVVSTCFAYGRTYGGKSNVRTKMVAPWFQKTASINGGACNDVALACYDMKALKVNRRYRSPDSVADLMNVRSGQWNVVQAYRFVTGSYSGKFFSWDCTSSDWRAHWTNNAEMYCWNDYLSAIDRIPAGVTVTDPATVATAWGRGNPGA